MLIEMLSVSSGCVGRNSLLCDYKGPVVSVLVIESLCIDNRNVDNILSKKFKPPFPHILDEYIYIYSR